MRMLTSAVLVMEAIVLGLTLPVVIVVNGQSGPVVWFLAAIALGCLILPAFARRPFYEPVGWLLQGAAIASGLITGWMYVLGGIFAILWWTALRLGKRVDGQQVQAGPPASPSTSA